MIKHRFGLNMNAMTYTEDQIMTLGTLVNATTHLTMHSPKLAQRLFEQSGKTLISISRDDYPDGAADFDVVKLANKWASVSRQYPDIYHYFPNEPSVKDRTELIALLKRLVNLMRLSNQMHFKACIGNIGWAGMLQIADVEAGIWDEFIIEASKWTRNGLGVIGGHDYTFGLLPWGTAGRNPYHMLTPGLVTPDKWPDAQEVQDKYRDNWLLLRFIMLEKRAQWLGVPMFLIVITEAPWDRMPNLEAQVKMPDGSFRPGVIVEFDKRFGKTYGPISQKKLFNFWLPDMTEAQAAMRQVAWMDEVYPEYVLGFTFFTINRNWPDYDFYTWPEFLTELGAYVKKVPVEVDYSNPIIVEVKPVGDFDVVMRSAPEIRKENIVGVIPKGVWTRLQQFPNNSPVGTDRFVPVRYGSTTTSWVSKPLLEFREHAPPTPDPAPVPPPGKEKIDAAFKRLYAAADDLKGLILG